MVIRDEQKFLVVNEQGIYQSTDEGRTWIQLDLKKQAKKYEGLEIDKYTLHQVMFMDIYK